MALDLFGIKHCNGNFASAGLGSLDRNSSGIGKHMKRLLVILLASCLLLTGCGLTSLGSRIKKPDYDPVMEELVGYINKNDADGIVSMFSEEVRESNDTLKEDAQALIDLFGHHVVSYESKGGSESSSTRPMKRRLSWHFIVETDDNSFYMSWDYMDENDENPKKRGFSEISVRTKEFYDKTPYGIDIDGILIVTEDNYYDLKYKEAELHGEEYYPGKETEEKETYYEYIVAWGTVYYPTWEETKNGTKFLKCIEESDGSMIKLVGKNNGINCTSDQLPFQFDGTFEEMDVHFGDIVIDEDSRVYIFYDEGHGTFAKVGQITKYTENEGLKSGIERLKTEDDLQFQFDAILCWDD